MLKMVRGPSEIHRMRYAKNKLLGVSTENIAKEEGVLEKNVKKSIALVETYRSIVTIEDLEASQVEVILANKDLEAMALRNALQARIVTRDDNGKIIAQEPNYEVQLSAVKTIGHLTENLMSSRSRGVSAPGNVTNVNVVAGGGAAVGIATFEDRLREVKRKRGLLLEQHASAITVPAEEDEDMEEMTPDWGSSTVESSTEG